ncbi:MAG TPA: nodulation protein NfeD [bacterium]|nr:nodulation protein NfeD [bacterium]
MLRLARVGAGLQSFIFVVPIVLTLWAASAAPGAGSPSASSAQSSVVDVVHLVGVVSPSTARYVIRGIREAEQSGAQALLIEVDTPGGLLKSMDDMTRAMLNANVPTVVYVYPSGSRAASAGVFISYAATIAAMAPTTHLGAAHPVGVGNGGTSPEGKTLIAKVTNDAVAQIRGFAERRGRNADWAEKAVRESVSITETQALHLHVIDLIADTPGDLLAKLDGREVETASGKRRLHTLGARLVDVPMDVTEQFLGLLSDPNIGFILMTMAIYGIIFELSNPGSVFPGVIGGLALILALASFAVLEVNVAGLFLIGFALILFIADIKVPSHGVLTAGGLVSFVLGSLLLTERQAPFLRISLTLILSMAAVTGGFFAFAVGAGIRAQTRKVQTGREGLVGATGVVRSDLNPSGTVFVQGELWSAESLDGSIPVGGRVRVARVDGLRLQVKREEASAP